MHKKLTFSLTIAAILTTGALLSPQRCSTTEDGNGDRKNTANASTSAGKTPVVQPPAAAENGESPRKTAGYSDDPRYQAIVGHLDRLTAALKQSPDPDTADAIRALLRESVAEPAVAAILAFLDSGEDAETGAQFVVGVNAFLDSAPTVRVLLLDALGELDARVAAECAREIFNESRSADEWAIALKNHAAGNDLRTTENALADSYFKERVLEALSDDGWASEPTVGFLHTLDFAVLAPDQETVAALAGLTDGDSAAHPAVKRVAIAQLRRMAHRDYSGTIDLLYETNAHSQLDPESRAVLFAHADLRDDRHLLEIETYLSSDLGEAELTRFADVFPYFGLDVTNHLATQNGRVDMKDDADAVMNAFATVQQWRGESRFAGKDAALGKIELRLERLVRSIERGVFPDGE